MNMKILDEAIALKNNAMLKVRPELFYEWNFEKNNELGLDVYKVTKGSEKKAWWNCLKCKSVYKNKIVYRMKSTDCPYCAGVRVNHTNSLATLNPEIASQWHPVLNGELTPHDFTYSSNEKIWWLCSVCFNDFNKPICNRVRGVGCPHCSGREVSEINSLSSLYPSIASEWNQTLNKSLSSDCIFYKSTKKIWWTCSKCKSDYDARVQNRTMRDQGCPYCSGMRINHTNSLFSLMPDLAKEWHPTKNGKLTPHDVTLGNDKIVWWIGECGHEWDVRINHRTGEWKFGCPYCSGSRLLVGFNDMWTTNPELAKLLANSGDGYKYFPMSSIKVNWICPECENLVKNRSISQVNGYGLSCPSCSDGVSFGERFIYNLFKLKEIAFDFESPYSWSQRKRYDFYLPEYNWIIEVHGKQHYEEGFVAIPEARNLKEEQENDRLKEELAKNNGIDNYIVIDARYSTVEWIKNSILNSDIMNIVGDVDFAKIGELSSKSFVKIACDLWNSKEYSVEDISEIMKISNTTTRRYLKRGTENKWCDYVATDRSKSIVQLNYRQECVKVWRSGTEAAKHLPILSTSISLCLTKGIGATAGGYFWLYKEDYDLLKDEIHSGQLSLTGKTNKREIVQLNRNSEFIKSWASISESVKTLGVNGSTVSAVCKGKLKTHHGFKWMYKEDYEEHIKRVD